MPHVSHAEESGAEEMVQGAGEAMLLMVPQALWETLVRQARAEERRTGHHVTPGQVLDRAVKEYLERNGEPEAAEYLHALAAQGGR